MLKKRVGKKRTWVTQEITASASPGERLAAAHSNALKSLQSSSPSCSSGNDDDNLQQHQHQHHHHHHHHHPPRRYRWCLDESCLYSSVVPIPNTAVAELAHLIAHHPSKYNKGPHPFPHLSEDEVAAGVARATLLVGAAWREERRDPAAAICLAAEAAEAAEAAAATNETHTLTKNTDDNESQHIVRRSCFIFGKLLVEAFVEFDHGAMLLEHALGTKASTALLLPAAEQRRRRDEEVGIAFHLSRALYDNYRYDECWNVLVRRTRQHFPDAWIDSTPPGSVPLPTPTTTTASIPAPAPTSKYHRAMLLHGCVLAAVFRPTAATAVSNCIAEWIDEHRDVMWRQFNAEIRFATVIQRLLPMAPPFAADAAAPAAASREPIYALGESHTLPLIWQTLDLEGTLGSRRVLPRLVIGLKAWHFNPQLVQCRERGILLSHAASIPPRSTIIICAGEIDLREAGAIAMLPQYWGEHRPKKYASSAAGIAVTVEAFFAGLRDLRDSGEHARLLLHPVRPPPRGYHAVECHGLTVQWNEAVAAACADPANARISQLDFFDDLCEEPPIPAASAPAIAVAPQTPSATGLAAGAEVKSTPLLVLRPDFHIGDGFHLNRKYLPLVASSISRSLRGLNA